MILAQGGPLEFDLQGGRNHKAAPANEDRSEFYTEAEWRDKERVNLIHALKHAGGKVSGAGGAAELLGVNPNTLASRLRALGISRSTAGEGGNTRVSRADLWSHLEALFGA